MKEKCQALYSRVYKSMIIISGHKLVYLHYYTLVHVIYQ